MTDDPEKELQAILAQIEAEDEQAKQFDPEQFEPNALEREILDCSTTGREAYLGADGDVRADFLKILLLGLRKDWQISATGVRLFGANRINIVGDLLLAEARGPDGGYLAPLHLNFCRLDGVIDLRGAQIASVNLDHCRNVRLKASQVGVNGDLSLCYAHCQYADAVGARIGGSLIARNARITGDAATPSGVRLRHARVGGDMVLEGIRCRKCVFDLSNAVIEGELSASRLRILNGNAKAFVFSNARITGGATLDFIRIRGGVDGANTQLAAPFLMRNSVIANRGDTALTLEFAKVEGVVVLGASGFRGQCFLTHCRIDGQIRAIGSRFDNGANTALNITGARAASVLLRETVIAGGLSADGTVISALSLAGSRITAGASGIAVNLINAHVEQYVELSGGGPSQPGAAVIVGAVNFYNARIGGRVRCVGASFTAAPQQDACLFLYRTRIDGALELRDLKGPLDGRFDLGGAEIDMLDDDPETGWPAAGLVNLDGLTYRTIATPVSEGDKDRLAGRRLAWLKRQYADGEPRRGGFRPQPFEQLASVLRGHGHDYAAVKIAIEKRELQRKCADRGFARFLHTILKITSDYGYSPARALAWFALWVGLGAVIAAQGLRAGLYEGASLDATETAGLEPISYAFDLATPIIDFGQASAYQLKPACDVIAGLTVCGGRGLLEIAYSVIGFVLFSILVLTFSGVLRREG